MDIKAILQMDPKSKQIHYDGTEDWKHCYFQFKNESNSNIDPNKLPLLDEEYLNDTGEPLLNDDNQEVYDPEQEIEYERYHEIGYKQIYSSKIYSFNAEKLKELIDSGKLSDESYDYELFEALDLHQGHGRHCLMSFFMKLVVRMLIWKMNRKMIPCYGLPHLN